MGPETTNTKPSKASVADEGGGYETDSVMSREIISDCNKPGHECADADFRY
jgi:hypothetical protein